MHLDLDAGEIRGGFGHDYEARIIPAPDTAILRAVEKSTGVRRERSLTVQIESQSGCHTVGFTCDDWNTELSPCLFTTPNSGVLGVRLQGCVYVVDVGTGESRDLSIAPLMAAASDTQGGVMFFADYIRVGAFNGTEFLWVSDRVALDGITKLVYDNGVVHGLAFVGGGDAPFAIDANTGEVRGGFREKFPNWPA